LDVSKAELKFLVSENSPQVVEKSFRIVAQKLILILASTETENWEGFDAQTKIKRAKPKNEGGGKAKRDGGSRKGGFSERVGGGFRGAEKRGY